MRPLTVFSYTAIHCAYINSTAQITVQTRYPRCPIASPNPKYSHSATAVSTATATATTVVEPHTTSPITTGINTAAVATRFHVIVSTPRHSERSPRSEGWFCIARLLCDESLRHSSTSSPFFPVIPTAVPRRLRHAVEGSWHHLCITRPVMSLH